MLHGATVAKSPLKAVDLQIRKCKLWLNLLQKANAKMVYLHAWGDVACFHLLTSLTS